MGINPHNRSEMVKYEKSIDTVTINFDLLADGKLIKA